MKNDPGLPRFRRVIFSEEPPIYLDVVPFTPEEITEHIRITGEIVARLWGAEPLPDEEPTP